MKISQYLLIKQKAGDLYIAAESIIYGKSGGSYCTLYLDNNTTLVFSKNLASIEKQLSTFWFVRIHKSHIVNLKHISQYFNGDEAYVIMTDKTKLPVSRRKKIGIFNSLHYKDNIMYRFLIEPVDALEIIEAAKN